MLPASMMIKMVLAVTMAVESLNKLSPSTKMVKRLGTPNCLKSEITATGSVALKLAPSNNAVNNGNEVRDQTINPMMAVERNNPGMASVNTGAKLCFSKRASMAKADSNIRVGKHAYKIISG